MQSLNVKPKLPQKMLSATVVICNLSVNKHTKHVQQMAFFKIPDLLVSSTDNFRKPFGHISGLKKMEIHKQIIPYQMIYINFMKI